MDEYTYKLIKIGKLKYDRLKAISILKNELKLINSNVCCLYSLADIKELIDYILIEKLECGFNLTYKICFDCIFDDNQYETIYPNNYCIERNFPENWIPPTG